MESEQIFEKFKKVIVRRIGDKYCPHKPLLILYAIGKLQRGEKRLIPYSKVNKDLEKLLQEFESEEAKKGTHYPFWRLQKYCVWEVTDADQFSENSKGDVKKTELLNLKVSGGFPEAIFNQFQKDNQLVLDIINYQLDYLCSSQHNAILQAVGIEISNISQI